MRLRSILTAIREIVWPVAVIERAEPSELSDRVDPIELESSGETMIEELRRGLESGDPLSYAGTGDLFAYADGSGEAVIYPPEDMGIPRDLIERTDIHVSFEEPDYFASDVSECGIVERRMRPVIECSIEDVDEVVEALG